MVNRHPFLNALIRLALILGGLVPSSVLIASTANADTITQTSTPSTGSGCAIQLTLNNVAAGGQLQPGSTTITGIAKDQTASNAGNPTVQAFVGDRTQGGTFVGNGNFSGTSGAFNINAQLPSNQTGGKVLFVYASSTSTNQVASLQVPFYLNSNLATSGVAISNTVTVDCPSQVGSTTSSSSSSTTATSAPPAPAVTAPAPATSTTGTGFGPVVTTQSSTPATGPNCALQLTLNNPTPGALFNPGRNSISGTARDLTAPNAGNPRIAALLSEGGASSGGGNGVGTANFSSSAAQAQPFTLTAQFPPNEFGGATMTFVATSQATGQQTTIAVPIYVNVNNSGRSANGGTQGYAQPSTATISCPTMGTSSTQPSIPTPPAPAPVAAAPTSSSSSGASGSGSSTTAADGQSLNSQPAATQASFIAVWGDQAAQDWVKEHNASLAGH